LQCHSARANVRLVLSHSFFVRLLQRAIVNEAPLILADEPTGTLDTQTGGEIMEVFLSLNANGQTIFMVTHNAENARLAHRMVNMTDGRLNCGGRSPGRRSLKPEMRWRCRG
jgi:ABC-type lipoprotein export system ATPase subunit